jgi:rRNA maturation endonuclease Nob1
VALHITHGDTQALNLLTEDPLPEVADDQPDEDPEKKKELTGPSKVIFLTSDFAMQNVIIQMGFILLTHDGMRLKRVRRFKLLCRACFKLNLDVERKFCE